MTLLSVFRVDLFVCIYKYFSWLFSGARHQPSEGTWAFRWSLNMDQNAHNFYHTSSKVTVLSGRGHIFVYNHKYGHINPFWWHAFPFLHRFDHRGVLPFCNYYSTKGLKWLFDTNNPASAWVPSVCYKH